MKKTLLLFLLVAALLGTAVAQKRQRVERPQRIAVAYFDKGRLQTSAGQEQLEQFHFFNKRIEEIVKRDFPGVQLKILEGSGFMRLHDGTGLNVQNIPAAVGIMLTQRGKKHRLLAGVQTDADFACAAAAYFKRKSPACPK